MEEFDKELVDSQLKRITKVRFKLLTDHPFFGILALYLVPRPMRLPFGAVAGCDGEYLYFDPEAMKEKVPKDDELVGIVAHEVMHAAMDHMNRRSHRIPVKWNFATDLAINPIIKESNIDLPKWVLMDDRFKDMAAEKIYALLPEPITVTIKVRGPGMGKDDQGQPCPGDGQAGGKDGEGGDEETQTIPNMKGELIDDISSHKGGNGDDEKNGGNGKSAKEMAELWKLRVASAAQAARQQGNLPGGLEQFIDDLESPRVDWRTVLAQYTVPTFHDYRWSPPDRRFAGSDIILPDFAGEGIQDVVVAIDTSGSISDAELKAFVSEVKGILKASGHVTAHLVDCDTQVYNWWTLDSFQPWPRIKVRGRGGTDFRPVFDEVKKRGVKPTVLVYLTDCYGDFPRRQPGYPVIWVTTGQDAPWGQVFEYDM